MQKKNNIVPPSKENTEPELSKEDIQALRNKRDTCRKELNELSMILDAEDNYDKALSQAAKKLNIDKSELNSTFKENKGALVNEFRKAKGQGNISAMGFYSTLFTSMTGFFGYVAITQPEAWPLILPAAFTGALSVVINSCIKTKFSDRTEARKSITDQVIQHKHRLADMTAPKVD